MKRLILLITLTSTAIFFAACSNSGGGADVQTGKTIKSAPVGDMTATLSSESGHLKNGDQELFLSFSDAGGNTVDVGAASLNFHMPSMGTMAAMNDAATLTTTAKPGVYKARVKIEMPGEWQAQITYEGPKGKGKTSFPLTAQ